MFLRKPGSTAAATREHSHGQGVWWGATAWRSSGRCCVTIADLSHAAGAVTRREDDAPTIGAGETLCWSGEGDVLAVQQPPTSYY